MVNKLRKRTVPMNKFKSNQNVSTHSGLESRDSSMRVNVNKISSSLGHSMEVL